MTSIVGVCNAVGRMSAALVLMALGADACAQPTYPSKAIRLIVPSTAGGNRDLSARLLGQKFAEAWGQNVIVDNRPGGNTLVGSEALVKATPDGHTLLLVDVSHLVNGLGAQLPVQRAQGVSRSRHLNNSHTFSPSIHPCP